MQPLRLALIGLGTVGSGTARILVQEAQRIEGRAGRPVEVRRVAVRDPKKPRPFVLEGVTLESDPIATAQADDVDVVVELIGGLSPAREIVEAALRSGKSVVTANKALLCEHGLELFDIAREHGQCIAYEAAVAGGVPIIAALTQTMTANQITSIQAIINGTSNFILTEMLDQNRSYDEGVRLAQEHGYAEADPSMDVDGTDAAQKLTLLTQLAFGLKIPLEDFPRQGIDTLELADLKYADELGYAVKLLATAKLTDGCLEMHTQPTLIRKDRPLAQIDDVYNMIALSGDVVGTTWFSGMGAGQMATASAVIADIVDVAVGRTALTFERLDLWRERPPLRVLPAERITRRYYLRFVAEDRPHVLADIADHLGRQGVSIASVIQHEAGEEGTADQVQYVPLVIMTHTTTEGQIRRALDGIRTLRCHRPPMVCMPVSD